RAQPAPVPAPIAPPPPARASVAATPPPPAAEPPQPAVTTRALTVEETYRASLAEQSRLPSAVAGVSEPPETLIVSSEGLETVRRTRQPDVAATSAPARQAGVLGGGVALRPAGQVESPADSTAIKIATIQFADGSSRLDDEARRVIGQVAKLHGEKGGTLRVVGHASLRTKPMDPDRHAKVNEGISIARANAVAGQLARLGVKRDAIVVSARGDSEPTYYEIMETGEAGNRRAEIYLEVNP
ncbi:MAG: OmpA family protein, partial [Rhodospirillales bacterium]|nr:OmpA family protein [Rhodospirillales bacterium]